MCFGININGNPCPYEIKTGHDAGECGKTLVQICPEEEQELLDDKEGNDNDD